MSFSSSIITVTSTAVIWGFLVVFFLKVLHLKRASGIIVIAVTTVVIFGSFIATAIARVIGKTTYRLPLMVASSGLPVVLYLSVGLVFVTVINFLWWLVRRPDRSRDGSRSLDDTGGEPEPTDTSPRSLRLPVIRLLTVIAVVGSLVTTGYGFVKAQEPHLTAMTLTFPDLPANFDGMTIALVSDLHSGATTRDSFLPMLVDQINAAHPDLIVIAGDTVDGSVTDVGESLAVLAKLSAPYGVVMTTGNHEIYQGARQWIEFYPSLGFRVLDNDAVLLQRGSQSITILGINDRRGTGDLAPDLVLAMDRGKALVDADLVDQFCILVAHEPVQVFSDDKAPSRMGIDLVLTGHTHGGQFWPIGYAALLSQPFLDGTHIVDNVTVVTSRGAGIWGPPIRIGADPEIPLITLHR
jgi:predicted MPP superfamily phosphohydrolase